MNSRRDDIIRKLAALRKMTPENGCTEDEALSAAARAAALMDEYGISEEEIANEPFEEREQPAPKRSDPYTALWILVAALCRCRTWRDPNGPRGRQIYFGQSSDLLIADYIHTVLKRAIERAQREFRHNPEYRRRRKDRTRRRAMLAFQEGLSQSLQRKVYALMLQRYGGEDEAVTAINTRTAELKRELSLRGVRLKSINRKDPSIGRDFGSGYHAGRAAGAAVHISHGLKGEDDQTLPALSAG